MPPCLDERERHEALAEVRQTVQDIVNGVVCAGPLKRVADAHLRPKAPRVPAAPGQALSLSLRAYSWFFREPFARRVGLPSPLAVLAVSDSVNMSVDLSYGDVETVDINQGLTANFDTITAQNAFIQGNAALTAAQQSVALGPPVRPRSSTRTGPARSMRTPSSPPR
jgi:hypothetical protein